MSQRVDDTAAQKLTHLQRELFASIADKASGGDPVHIGVWHQQNMVVFKPHDLCSHLPARYAVVDSADIAHRCLAAGGLNGHPNDIFNLSRQAVGFRMIDLADHLSEHVLDSFPPGWADSLSRLPEYQPA